MLSSVLFSCKKDNDDNNQAKSKSTLLTQGSWHITQLLRRSDPADAWTTTSGDPCRADDILTFNSNLTWSQDDAAIPCGSGNPQIVETGDWNFTSNETHLNFKRTSYGGQVQDWTIDQLDETTMVVEYYYPVGGPYYKITWSH